MTKIPTGCRCIDEKLSGGISPQTVTLIYGEPETGKTTLALQCAYNCALQNLKVLFLDCDNTFYAKRLSQIAGERFEEIAERVILIKPRDFREQTAVVDNIQNYTIKNFGLIIFDTFTSLYGAKVCESSGKAFSVNRELNRQLAILAQTAKIRKIPVIVTSQVRCIIGEGEQEAGVRPVATRVIKFWADTTIALKPTEYPQTVKAIIEQKQQNNQPVTCYIQIVETGIQDSQSLT